MDESLLSEDSLFLSAFGSALTGVALTSIDGHFLQVNDALCAALGYRKHELLSLDWKQVTYPAELPGSLNCFERAARNHHPERFTTRFEHAAGHRIWAEVSLTTTMTGGDDRCFVMHVQDVTHQQLIDAALSAITTDRKPAHALATFAESLRRVVDFEQFSLTVAEGDDRYRRVVSVGRHPEEFAEGGTVPMEGNSVQMALETSAPVIVQDTRAGQFRFDAWLADSGVGSYVIVPLTAHGRTFGTFNIGFAEEDAAANSVVALLSSVSDAVAQGVESVLVFEQQKDTIARLRELDVLKTDFVGMVAHDLRTPISVVSGITKMLTTRWEDLTEDERVDLLGRAHANVERLSGIVSEIFQVAIIESGRLTYDIKPFDLAGLVRKVIEELRTLDQAPLEVALEKDLPPALGDEARNWQILSNLVSNARKFASSEEPIVIEVTTDGAFVRIAVIDRGIGIASADQAKIFDKFTKLQRARGYEKVEGTGLGLYLCKAMIESQAGRIWVESEPGKGSTFFYTLPAMISGAD